MRRRDIIMSLGAFLACTTVHTLAYGQEMHQGKFEKTPRPEEAKTYSALGPVGYTCKQVACLIDLSTSPPTGTLDAGIFNGSTGPIIKYLYVKGLPLTHEGHGNLGGYDGEYFSTVVGPAPGRKYWIGFSTPGNPNPWVTVWRDGTGTFAAYDAFVGQP